MRFEVEIRTLDSYAFTNVCVIKVDVEGSEMEVLEGARETILRDRPPLIVELLTGAHADPVALTETICTTYGYSAWLVTKDRARVEALPVMRGLGSNTTWGSPIRNRNVLFLPQRSSGEKTDDHRHPLHPRRPDRQLPRRARRGVPRARLSGLLRGAADRVHPRGSCAAILPMAIPNSSPWRGSTSSAGATSLRCSGRPCGTSACWAWGCCPIGADAGSASG